ncbi:hypothetical protein B0H14DRAFT_2578630 [Mycena olivaceomarginata]|nr:hypothetical protein B0H14DRAFT_2578630 [Mycena olivaceomarginata]
MWLQKPSKSSDYGTGEQRRRGRALEHQEERSRLPGYDSDDFDDEPAGLDNIPNPFDSTIAYGVEILDSHGKIPVDESVNDIWRDLDNSDYGDRTVFADMTPMMADVFDKTDDCTVSDAVRAMAHHLFVGLQAVVPNPE